MRKLILFSRSCKDILSIKSFEIIHFAPCGYTTLTTFRDSLDTRLTSGDRWCLCAVRWKEAWEAGNAPKVVPEATHTAKLEFVSLEELQEYVTPGN